MFKGLRACLQVAEVSGGDAAERNSEALLRVNQILYDMMQDLPRSPNELLPQVTELIPYFIENLGNSKVSGVIVTVIAPSNNMMWLSMLRVSSMCNFVRVMTSFLIRTRTKISL